MEWLWLILFIFAALYANRYRRERDDLQLKLRLAEKTIAELRGNNDTVKKSTKPVKTATVSTVNDRGVRVIGTSPVAPTAAHPIKKPATVIGNTNPVTETSTSSASSNIPKYLLGNIDFSLEGPRGLLALFYLGAFFIIAAALAFVNFHQGSLAPFAKMFVMIIVTLIFAAGGYFLARRQDLRLAGIIYIGIALILIPIDGVAFYFFQPGFSGGLIWLFTSLVFVTASYFFYRGVLRAPLMFQLILAGILSALWSCVFLGSLPIGGYCFATMIYGFILDLAGNYITVNKRIVSLNGFTFALLGGIFGIFSYIPGVNEVFNAIVSARFATVPVSEAVANYSWSTAWPMLLFALGELYFFTRHFITSHQDSDWFGTILSVLIGIFIALTLSHASVDLFVIIGIILGFSFFALSQPRFKYFTAGQQQINSVVSLCLAIYCCLVGIATHMPWTNSSSIVTHWLSFVYALVAFMYAFMRWRFARQSDFAWSGVVVSFILALHICLINVNVGVNISTILFVVLAYSFAGFAISTTAKKILTSSQIHIARYFSVGLLIIGSILGVANNLHLHSTWSQNWPAVFYSVAAWIYFAIRFARSHSDFDWFASLSTFLISIGIALVAASASLNIWSVTVVILGYIFFASEQNQTISTILSTQNKALLSLLSPLFVLIGSSCGLLFHLSFAATWVTSWPMLAFALACFVYFALRFLISRNIFSLVISSYSFAICIAVSLYLSHLSVGAWGWSYYLFGFALFGLPYIYSAFWQQYERKFLQLSSIVTIALTAFFLFVLGYHGDFLVMPFVFILIPWLYCVMRFSLARTLTWKFITFYGLLAIGSIGITQLENSLLHDVIYWHIGLWLQCASLFALSFSLLYHLAQDSPTRTITDFIYGMTTIITACIFASFAAIDGDGLDSLRLVQLFTLALDIFLAYFYAAKYYLKSSDRTMLVSALWLVWWWLLAGYLELESIQWYLQPITLYIIMWYAWRQSQSRQTSNDLTLLTITACISALVWCVDIGVWMAMITGVFTFLLGWLYRERSLRIVGVTILVLAILFQFGRYILGIPVWLWYALIGIVLLAVATYALRREPPTSSNVQTN